MIDDTLIDRMVKERLKDVITPEMMKKIPKGEREQVMREMERRCKQHFWGIKDDGQA